MKHHLEDLTFKIKDAMPMLIRVLLQESMHTPGEYAMKQNPIYGMSTLAKPHHLQLQML